MGDQAYTERIEGPRGWAERQQVPEDSPACVDIWLIHAPDQSVVGPFFMLQLISLQPIPGWPPAVLKYPGAEWELVLVSLHPDRHPRSGDRETWHHLQPANFAHQFHGVTREQVLQLGTLVARSICDGILPAETQLYVELVDGTKKMMVIQVLWEMWEMSLADTLEHLRTGGHRSASAPLN